MSYYSYKTVDKRGKETKGKAYFENEDQLVRFFRKKDCFVIYRKKIKAINLEKLLPIANDKDISIFSKQLASLILAGFNISEALKIVYEQTYKKNFKSAIKEIQEEVEKGNSLYKSICLYEGTFPKFYAEMINIAEETGNLDNVLESLSTYFIKEYKAKRKIICAMIYPALILITTISVLFYIELNIVPSFSDTFNSLGTSMPAYSKLMINFSSCLKNNFSIFISFIMIVPLIIIFFIKSGIIKEKFDKKILKLPVIGKFKIKMLGARFARCLSISQRSGMDLVRSLELCSKVTNNSYFEKEILSVLNYINKGNSVAVTLNKLNIFPSFIISMISLGENGGNLDEMLIMAADLYDDEIDDSINRAISFIEPVMIMVLSLLVGGIIISILIPMLKMMEAI